MGAFRDAIWGAKNGDSKAVELLYAEILLDVIAGVDGIPPQTGEVFHNDAVDVTGLNI